MEVPLRIGSKVYTISAICVPAINISIKLPQLSLLARAFSDKGFLLADESLLDGKDEITNLDFVLGTKFAYCLNFNEVSFGLGEDSIYALEDIGVMLLGDLDVLMHNVSYLPCVKDSSSDLSLHSNVATCETYLDSFIDDRVVCKDPVSRKNLELVNNFACLSDDGVSGWSLLHTSANFLVMNADFEVNHNELNRATADILEQTCSDYTHVYQHSYDNSSTEDNRKLMKWALRSADRCDDRRIILSLLWKPNVKHFLGHNRNLSTVILKSNL